MACTNVLKAMQDKTIKQIKPGHFNAESKDDNSSKSGKATRKQNTKKGAAFAAVKDKSKSEDDKEQSTLPILEELLRSQGLIQLNVGAEKTWDSDCVSEFGFRCLHVERACASPKPRGVVLAGAGDKDVNFT